MRKIFKFITAISAAALLFGACSSSDGVDPTYVQGLTLTEISSTNYPQDEDNWVIASTSAKADDFHGLIAALRTVAYNEPTRQISLEFPNLKSIVDNALLLDDSDSSVSLNPLVSVSASYVTAIGESAFEGCKNLVKIDFPMAVTVGESAFEDCTSLANTSLGCVQSIGESAFKRCSSLSSITLYQLKSAGERAFAYCTSLTDVDLSLLEVASSGLFEGCVNLEDVELTNVATLSTDAFASCSSLESVKAPRVTAIYEAFISCGALTTLELATDSKIVIETFVSPFYGVDTNNISLSLGADNSKYVYKDTFFIFNDSNIYEFAKIELK